MEDNVDGDFVVWEPEWQGEDLVAFEKFYREAKVLGAGFRDWREALGLSQAEAAERLGTTQSNVSKIEARADPSISVLRKLIGVGARLQILAALPDGKKFRIKLD